MSRRVKAKNHKFDISTAELREQIKLAGLKVQPSYKHEDYMFTSFTAPYPVMKQLDTILHHIGCSRSSFIQTMITRAYERFNRGESAFGE
jgi:hypothetical protein